MDNSSLYEYSVPPKNQTFQKTMMIMLKTFRYLNVAAFVLFFIFALFVNTYFIILAGITAVAAIVLFFGGRLFYNFYDISYVGGSIRIIKVINNAYRRLAVTFETKDILSVGKIFGETFDKYSKDKSVKRIYASASRLTECDFCVLCHTKFGQTLIFMQYDEKFIGYLLRGAGIKVFDKDFIGYLRAKSSEPITDNQ